MSDTLARLNTLTQLLDERDLQLEKERRRLRAFNTIILRANSASNQKELIQYILDACLDIFKFDVGGVYLIRSQTAINVASNGISGDSHFIDRIYTENPDYERIFKEGSPLLIRDYDLKHPEDAESLNNVKLVLFVPIIYDKKVMGCITLGSKEDRIFNPDDCAILLTLGEHLGHVLFRLGVELKVERKTRELERSVAQLELTEKELNDNLARLEQSQKQLTRERENFHLLFNNIDDLIFVIDSNGIIVSINDAVRSTLGYPNGELIGQPIKNVHDPKECNARNQAGCSLVIGDTTYCPYTLVCKDGTKLRVETKTTAGLWDGRDVFYGVSRVRTVV